MVLRWSVCFNWLSHLQTLKCPMNMHAYWCTCTHIYRKPHPTDTHAQSLLSYPLSPGRRARCHGTLAANGFLTQRLLGDIWEKGFNWFKTNNYEAYFPGKSIFFHGCLLSGAVVFGWLGCTLPSLLVRVRELQCGCPFNLGRREVDACLRCTSIGCVASHAGSGAWVTVTTHCTPVHK